MIPVGSKARPAVCRETPAQQGWAPGGKIPFLLLFLWMENRSKSYQETGDRESQGKEKRLGSLSIPQGRFFLPVGEFPSPVDQFEQGTGTLGLSSTENHQRNENFYLLSSFPCEGRQSNLSSLPSWFPLLALQTRSPGKGVKMSKGFNFLASRAHCP